MRVRTSINIDKELLEFAKAESKAKYISMSDFINQLLDERRRMMQLYRKDAESDGDEES
jgi:hypothetical protein